jgi:hypothetical protein
MSLEKMSVEQMAGIKTNEIVGNFNGENVITTYVIRTNVIRTNVNNANVVSPLGCTFNSLTEMSRSRF